MLPHTVSPGKKGFPPFVQARRQAAAASPHPSLSLHLLPHASFSGFSGLESCCLQSLAVASQGGVCPPIPSGGSRIAGLGGSPRGREALQECSENPAADPTPPPPFAQSHFLVPLWPCTMLGARRGKVPSWPECVERGEGKSSLPPPHQELLAVRLGVPKLWAALVPSLSPTPIPYTFSSSTSFQSIHLLRTWI